MVRNIALLTGGDSSEWQIALQGAENIGNALDRSRYTPYTIVLRNGHWTYTAPDGTKSELDRNDFTLPVAGRKIKLDYALIVIHGTPGEDGRLQGYLDMMGIPYSSCGFVSSGADVRQSGLQTAVAGQRHPPGQRDSAEQNFGNRPRSHRRGIGLAAVCQTECERQQFRCHQGQETK